MQTTLEHIVCIDEDGNGVDNILITKEAEEIVQKNVHNAVQEIVNGIEQDLWRLAKNADNTK